MGHSRVLVGVMILGAASAACSKPRDNAARERAGTPAAGSAAQTAQLRVENSDGRAITAEELAHSNGNLHYSVVSDAKIPDEARKLHEQGRAAGGAGDYAKALALFAKAHETAPDWAYPMYDAGYTYELMDQPDKALASYDAVLKLEPRGFFNALSSADCLRREAAHEWQPGACKAYHLVEWLSPSKQKEALEGLVAKAPGLAAAWKDLAGHLDDNTARLKALEQGLSQRPDAQTRGFLLMNKGLMLDSLGKHDEARQILTALSGEPGLPVDVEQLVKLSLAQLDVKH